MKFRIWTSDRASVVPLNGEPFAVQPGQVVVVAVVDSYAEAAQVMESLGEPTPNAKRGKR